MTKPLYAFMDSPRCAAKSKRTGQRCKAAAVHGKRVCYHHGALAGAPSGKANGAYRHGFYTKAAIEKRRQFSAMLSVSRKILAGID